MRQRLRAWRLCTWRLRQLRRKGWQALRQRRRLAPLHMLGRRVQHEAVELVWGPLLLLLLLLLLALLLQVVALQGLLLQGLLLRRVGDNRAEVARLLLLVCGGGGCCMAVAEGRREGSGEGHALGTLDCRREGSVDCMRDWSTEGDT